MKAFLQQLVKGLVILFAGLFTSCASKNFSTSSNPASLRLEWTGGGLNYDRIYFVSGDKIGAIEHEMRASEGPFMLDPGDHQLGFRYFGNRGSLVAMTENLRTSETALVKARLEGGRDYLVRSSLAGASVRFSVIEQATGRVIGQSLPVATRPQPVKIWPAPYTPLPPVMLR